MKPEDNAANIQNANLGTEGVNLQYAKSQGNKGKQLNPNQNPTLVIAIRRDAKFSRQDPNYPLNESHLSFKEEYIDKGFLDRIGARLLDDEQVKSRRLTGIESDAYFFIEYLGRIQGGKKCINNKLANDFAGELSFIYLNVYWINGECCFNNHPDNDHLDYCAQIDGY